MFGPGYAQRYRLTRALLAALGLGVVLLWFAWHTAGPAPERRSIEARVLAVEQGQGTGIRTQSTAVLVTARVELPDGSEARVLITGSPPQPGASIALIEERRANGAVRYLLDRQSDWN